LSKPNNFIFQVHQHLLTLSWTSLYMYLVVTSIHCISKMTKVLLKSNSL